MVHEHEYEYDTVLNGLIQEEIIGLEGTEVYGCDLALQLCESINATGSYYCNSYRSRQFITENWEKAEEAYAYYKDELNMSLDVFGDVEGFMVCMLIKGVEEKLHESDFVMENWNDEFELTEDTINAILDELGLAEEMDSDMGSGLMR